MSFSQSAQALSVYETVENPRDTEYRLFAHITNALINHRDRNGKDTIEAIDWNRRLWLTLQSDVSSEANALSDDLRANVISLAIWVGRHSRAVMRGEASMDPLIQVNRTVMEGLRSDARRAEERSPAGGSTADADRISAAPARCGSVAMTEVSAPGNGSGTASLVRNQPAVSRRAEVGAESRGSQTASVGVEPKVSQPRQSQSTSTDETRLSIAFDQASNRFVYRDIDAGTGEVVNQLPPEEALRRFAYLRELAGRQSGRAVDTSA